MGSRVRRSSFHRDAPLHQEFKGSVNVEFNTKEEAEEFMKKKIMFAGVEITEKELLADREKSFDEKNVAAFPFL